MYKAIFLDLDGTLLDDQKNISDINKSAIKKAIDNGIYVILCSGRQQQIVKNFKELAGASNYIISSNGAEIMNCDNNDVLFSASIDRELVGKLYEYVKENNFVSRIDTPYARYLNDMYYAYGRELELYDEDKFFLDNDVIQFTIVTHSEEEVDKAIEFVKSLNRWDIKIENRYRAVTDKWDTWSINIISKSASKGNAISGLCKYLKIDLQDVIAMGDDYNDISMIETVGYGVAMANAQDDVKEIAKEITLSNNDNGVANIINKLNI